MCTDLLSTIGSGAQVGTHGIARTTGIIIRVGGTTIIAGHMTGIGVTAMLTIITTTGARSVRDIMFTMVIMNCTTA